MKIQHWAIVFIIIILPFSIIARSTISKKAALLKEETRYNNIVDNATYDATTQLLEAAMLENGAGTVFGKNLPISKGVADEVVDRFFDTLAVNFNLPIIKSQTNKAKNSAKAYFSQYIPAIIIVGYDGLYVYSYENNGSGYDYVLKPKIPYAYSVPDTGLVINFTLDNYVYLVFSDNGLIFDQGDYETRTLKGYVGIDLDYNDDGLDDFRDHANRDTNSGYYENGDYFYIRSWLPPTSESDTYDKYDTSNDDPYSISTCGGYNTNAGDSEKLDFIIQNLPGFTDNVSYTLYEMAKNGNIFVNSNLRFLIDEFDSESGKKSNGDNYDNQRFGDSSGYKKASDVFFSEVNVDYKYDDEGKIIQEASTFHKIRRKVIVDLIQNVLRQEFNEHNSFADVVGLKYDFAIPDIGRDQWNNTINDISVLSFIQGMPMGYNTYYNNYSLGGARIVQKHNFYGERLTISSPSEEHLVYHKYYCPLIPRDAVGTPLNQLDIEQIHNDTGKNKEQIISNLRIKNETGDLVPLKVHGTSIDRINATSGIIQEFLNEDDAHSAGYYACSECM